MCSRVSLREGINPSPTEMRYLNPIIRPEAVISCHAMLGEVLLVILFRAVKRRRGFD
jgi:hypothetical protein